VNGGPDDAEDQAEAGAAIEAADEAGDGDQLPNVLADRYASPAVRDLWSPAAKVRLERELWLAVLEAQRAEGVPVPPEAVAAYRAAIRLVDLASIRRRERITRHDVKARLEEFNALADRELIHLGLTSRDVTENVEQLQVRRSLEVVRDKVVALLRGLAERAGEYESLVIAARTHNVAAQPTTMGKRLAATGEELLHALGRAEDLLVRYPLRGIKGAVGTQQDLVELLGDPAAAERIDRQIAERLGFRSTLVNVGQVYPRSLDLDVVATLVQVAAAPANLALTLRLMAGHELATEGFRAGQVGSSAMPHKTNTRSSERISGLLNVLRGHLTMAAGLAGDQWYEGDVSCSVVRRVVLADAFLAVDGLLETTLEVVRELGVYPAVIDEELRRYLPFLSTTRLLIAAVQRGLGREAAHELIREHAVAAARDRRVEGADPSGGGLLERLGRDPRFPFSAGELDQLVLGSPPPLGRAVEQVRSFLRSVDEVVARHPEAAAYAGREVL
jgi:adenylosuccinate lyase